MSLFNFLRGEFIDVIHWVDDTRDTIVWRFERRGHAIKYGAKLTVREGQAAVFVHEGQLADVFGPGLYELETNNLPVLTTLQHWHHGFQSPFVSEIYFVNTRRFTDLKWGTRNPITCRDPEFGMVRLRAFGTYAMRVADPAKFMTEIVGTDGEFTTGEIEFQIRNHIVSNFSQIIASAGIPVLDMAANTLDLSKIVAERIAPRVAEYGLELPSFYIENVSLPEDVERVLDQRTKMGIVGDLGRYQRFATAEAMQAAAANPGGDGGMGAGLGMGVGMAMANQMSKGLGGQPAAGEAPPPPPVDKVWHVAEGDETRGPFSQADLAAMGGRGELRHDSHVWTPGQDGWRRAGDVPELAQLFATQPPPPPGV
jgi:membrane protease subunit (stomatin/prohibitin family)